jgi:hypothetical protein
MPQCPSANIGIPITIWAWGNFIEVKTNDLSATAHELKAKKSNLL